MSTVPNTSDSASVLLGGSLEDDKGLRWQATLRLEYSGAGKRPVVFKRMGLTVLEEKTAADVVIIDKPVMDEQVNFRMPTLLEAYPQEGEAELELQWNKTTLKGKVLLGLAPRATGVLPPLAVTPAHGAWPPQHRIDYGDDGRTMNLPHLRVADGRLPGVLQPGTGKTSLARALRLEADQVLGGLKIASQGGKGLAIELTAEGIEFSAHMPDPTADLRPGAGLDGTIEVIVRLEADGKNGAFLRLVDCKDKKTLDAMEARLASAFATLRTRGTPADLNFDVRPVIPSLRWPLLMDKSGKLSIDASLAGGTGHRFSRWNVLLDEEIFDARIRSVHEGETSVATVVVTSARMSRTAVPPEVTLELNEAPKGDIVVDFKSQPDGTWTCDADFPQTKPQAVTIDLDAPAERLERAFVGSHALAPGEPLPSMFVAVRDGILQLPVPPPVDPVLARATSGGPATAALQGRLRAKGPLWRPGRVLTIESSERCGVAIVWAGKPYDFQATQVRVGTRQPSGRLQGYLFALEGSPTPEEVLPTLGAGAAATRDLPLSFGAPRTSGRWWNADFERLANDWRLSMNLPDGAWAWMRDAECGMVGIVPLTRASRGSAKPSVSRSFIPVQLTTRPDKPSRLEILANESEVLGRASCDGVLSWITTEDVLDSVMPTLPGVQFRPAWKSAAKHLNDWTWTAKVRHGLPALDEFFGNVELPRPAAPAQDEVLASAPPAPTALRPDELKTAWLRSFDKMRLSWAQSRFAHAEWIKADGMAVPTEVIGLAEPFRWKTSVSINRMLPPSPEPTQYGFAGPVPLGSYVIDGKRYAMATALPGFGIEGEPQPFTVAGLEIKPGGSSMTVTGMAASTIDAGESLQMDSRGLAISSVPSSRPDGKRSCLLRPAHRLDAQGKLEKFALLTLPLTVDIGATLEGGGRLGFFARDLPVVGTGSEYDFDGENNPAESSPGENGMAFERDAFGHSLHEWRLFEVGTGDGRESHRRYDISWGPLAFTPLRLWKLKLRQSESGPEVVSFSVLGRLNLSALQGPWTAADDRAPFGPEEPYAEGDYFLLNLAEGKLSLQAQRVEEKNGVIAVTKRDPGTVTLQVSAWDQTAKRRNRIATVVKLDPTDKTATLQARLFGSNRTLHGKVVDFTPEKLAITCTPVDHSAAAAQATEVKLVLVRSAADWESSIEIGMAFDLRNSNDASLFSRDAKGTWRWLNLPEQVEPPDALVASHATGGVTLSIDHVFSIAQPLLGFSADDFRVSGLLAHVFADDGGWPRSAASAPFHFEFTGKAKEEKLRIHHAFSGTGQDAKSHRLRIDYFLRRTSVVQWPTSAQVRPDEESMQGPPEEVNVGLRKWARLVDIERADDVNPLLEHNVELQLSDHVLPESVLINSNSGLAIGKPWRSLACVRHALGPKSAKDPKVWSTFDRICVEPADALHASASGGDSFYVYAARYVNGHYRTRIAGDLMKHPGVGRRGIAQSGWSDQHIAPVFGTLKDRWQPVIHGGSYTLFELDPAATDPRARAAVIPWLIDFAADTDGPLAQVSLRQSGSAAHRWRFASVDALADENPLSLGRMAASISVSASMPESDVEDLLLQQMKNDDPREGNKALEMLRQQVPVTQAYFELFKKPAANSMDIVPPAEVPYFLHATLVLCKVWRTPLLAVNAFNLIATGDSRGRSLRVRTLPPTMRPANPLQSTPVDLVVLSEKKVHRFPGVMSVPVKPSGHPLDTFDDGRSRARLREFVLQRAPDAAVVLARASTGTPDTGWRLFDVPPRSDDYGLHQPRADLPEPLPASPALGWPSSDGTELLSRLGAVVGHDLPLVSPSSGLAARASVLRFPAWAPGPGQQEAIYLSLASHVVFDRGEFKADQQILFRGPPARHLAVAPVRIRAPLESETQEALARLAPAPNGLDVVAPVTPPHVERASLGHRAGEFHAWTARLVLPAEPHGFDPDHPSYGRPASSAPVIAQQLRTPRAPLLPDDQELELRRRTFVSGVDEEADNRLRQMIVFDGHATVARFLEGGKEYRYAIQPVGQDGKTPFRLDAGWDGILRLAISGAGTNALDKDWLAHFGLAPHEKAKTNGALRIGALLMQFDLWQVADGPDGRVLASLIMKADNARAVAAEVGRVSVDTPILLEFQAVRTQQPHVPGEVKLGLRAGAALRDGPPVNLTLPLLRGAGDRVTLPVKIRTLVFGDPAYDRQLGSPAFRSEPVEVDATIGTVDVKARLVLAVDREEYHLDDSVHLRPVLVADKAKDGTGSSLEPKLKENTQLKLSVDVIPKRREDDVVPPQLRRLLVPDAQGEPAEDCAAGVASVYALHPRSLLEKNSMRPAQLNPGDQLRLTLTISVTEADESQVKETKVCIVMVRLTDLPSIAPPPAVYSLVTIDAGFTRAEVALHACAPLPDNLEYPSLAKDLANGYVRRRALFIWPWGSLQDGKVLANLVKVDRSGGAQLPTGAADFMEVPTASASITLPKTGS